MSPSDDNRAAMYAAGAAAAMIGNQVAGKAARDAIFLANFDVVQLPTMLAVAAAVSLLAVVVTSRLMTLLGPQRLAPVTFGVSASLFVAEWLVHQSVPRVAAVILYIHMAVFGATLISIFWSLINERFDPHSAKKRINRITVGSTLGGLLGGMLAERVAAYATMEAILPVLAVLHVASGVLLLRVGDGDAAGPTLDPAELSPSGLTVLGRAPYLRNLAALIFLSTVATTAVDYVFKAEAAATYHDEDLMRFFAVFYTALGVVTFLVQASFTRPALEGLGLAPTLASLPVALFAGSVAALFMPGLLPITTARSAEATLRSSLFRSAYELMYTPASPRQKRATKQIIDVGFDRAGDAAGGGLIRLILILLPAFAHQALLLSAAGFSLVALWVGMRLRRGYIKALEDSLLDRAPDLDAMQVADLSTRAAMHSSLGSMLVADPAPLPPPTHDASADPYLQRVADLRSGDLARVERALAAGDIDGALVGQIVPLLAWDAAVPPAVDALRTVADLHCGQLVDSLLSPHEEFAVRRRLPRVLAACTSPIAAAGLELALRDKRFEVRFQAGRALSQMVERNAELRVDAARLFDRVLEELHVDRRVWESRQLLDAHEPDAFVDDLLRARSSRSLEHVFRLLALVLPAAPLRVAYRGLHTDDRNLRGTALEYLESVLPKEVRDALWPVLEAEQPLPTASARAREEALSSLMRSHESIEINLDALREKLKAPS